MTLALTLINQIQIPKCPSKQPIDQILSEFISKNTADQIVSQIKQHKPLYKNGNLCKVKTVTFQSIPQLKNKLYALKVIYKDRIQKQDYQSQAKRIYNEIQILYKLNSHPNIIKLFWHRQFEQEIWLLFQCFGSKLYKFMRNRKMTEDQIKKIVQQLCQVLQVLHDNQGFIHRDISTDNILINENLQVKVIDFGFANQLLGGRRTQLGSFEYMAPQIIKGQNYNHKADIWSLAVVIFQLFFGRNPFSSGSKFNQEEIRTNRSKMIYNFHPSQNQPYFDVPQRVKDLIRKLLVQNPEERLEARQILEHPWFIGTIQLQKSAFDNDEDDFNQIFKKDQNRYPQGSFKILEDQETTQKKQQIHSDRGSFDNFLAGDSWSVAEKQLIDSKQPVSIQPKRAVDKKQKIHSPVRKTEKVTQPQISSANVSKQSSIRELQSLLCSLIGMHGEELNRKKHLLSQVFESQIKLTELNSRKYGVFKR